MKFWLTTLSFLGASALAQPAPQHISQLIVDDLVITNSLTAADPNPAPPLTPRLVLTGPAFAPPGTTITINMGLDTLTGSNMVGLNWTDPVNVTISGPQPSIPSKATICNGLSCMLVGIVPAPTNGTTIQPSSTFNVSPLLDGPLQTFNFTIPAAATIGSTITLTPTSATGVNANGDPITFNIVAASITVGNPLDLNSDGVIDYKDAQLALDNWNTLKSDAAFAQLVRVISQIH